MSDPSPDDIEHRVFRAMVPGMSAVPRPPDEAMLDVFAPARGRLEASIALAAFAILVPVCADGSLACAGLARSGGNRRWAAAMAAAGWCGVLGVILRVAIGMQLVP